MSRNVLLCAAALSGLTFATQALADAPKVVASIKPVHSLVSAVMDGVAAPGLIVEGSGSPHSYAMRPSQAAALDAADIVFWVGEDLEPFLEEPLETLGADARIVELSAAHGLTTLPFREGGPFESHGHAGDGSEAGDDHDGHDHEARPGEGDEDHDRDVSSQAHDHDAEDRHAQDRDGIDMHLWLDPANARVWVREIERVLTEADPANAERYEANAAAVTGKLAALEAEIAASIEPVRGRPFIVFHDGYQYFEHRFGIPAAGSITVSPEVAPGAQRIAEMQARLRELGVVCVFAEPQFEPRIIDTVIEGTKAKAGVLDPIGSAIGNGPDLYFELMRSIAGSLKDCLSESS